MVTIHLPTSLFLYFPIPLIPSPLNLPNCPSPYLATYASPYLSLSLSSTTYPYLSSPISLIPLPVNITTCPSPTYPSSCLSISLPLSPVPFSLYLSVPVPLPTTTPFTYASPFPLFPYTCSLH